VRPGDPAAAEALARAVGISPMSAQILIHRGLTDGAAARDFLRPQIGRLRDPYEIPGMGAAIERLAGALARGETIGIFGDYDVDGVSGTALMTRALRLLGSDPPAYIPHRTQEGYGMNEAGLQVLADRGVRLLVTIDTGTTAHGPIARARELGMDVIVLDHHAPDAALPDGAVVVNPMLAESPNPLASVGVCFKTVWALAHRTLRAPADLERLAQLMPTALALATLGTVADVCPLLGDNRILVGLGLEHLRDRPSVGLAALRRTAGLEGRALSAADVAFRLAPRLNAAGRMLNAAWALELLLTEDESRAGQIAAELEMANRKRQQTEDEILKDATARIEASGEAQRERILVLADERWHSGVVGIVAARLVERYARPVFLIGLDGAQGRGSARTVAGFNLKEAIGQCADLLVSGGGHAQAGGLTIRREKIESFAERMRAIGRERLRPEDLVPTCPIDLELSLEQIGPGFMRELERMEPFGIGNPRPVFCARGVRVAGAPRLMGRDGRHLMFFAAQGGASLRAVGWQMADQLEALTRAERLDLAFTLESNTWQGQTNLELIVKDLRALDSR
jgi:single-stranded-DNA-specific exonuclease